MLAPVSGNASICRLVPSRISISTWTSSNFSGLWIEKIFADPGVPDVEIPVRLAIGTTSICLATSAVLFCLAPGAVMLDEDAKGLPFWQARA